MTENNESNIHVTNVLVEKINELKKEHAEKTGHEHFEVKHILEDGKNAMMLCGMPNVDDKHKAYNLELEELSDEHGIDTSSLIAVYRALLNPMMHS